MSVAYISPTTQISVENGSPSFFYRSQATYAMNENVLYFDRFAFFSFFEEDFCRHSENNTIRKLKRQNLEVMLCFVKISHIQ